MKLSKFSKLFYLISIFLINMACNPVKKTETVKRGEPILKAVTVKINGVEVENYQDYLVEGNVLTVTCNTGSITCEMNIDGKLEKSTAQSFSYTITKDGIYGLKIYWSDGTVNGASETYNFTFKVSPKKPETQDPVVKIKKPKFEIVIKNMPIYDPESKLSFINNFIFKEGKMFGEKKDKVLNAPFAFYYDQEAATIVGDKGLFCIYAKSSNEKEYLLDVRITTKISGKVSQNEHIKVKVAKHSSAIEEIFNDIKKPLKITKPEDYILTIPGFETPGAIGETLISKKIELFVMDASETKALSEMYSFEISNLYSLKIKIDALIQRDVVQGDQVISTEDVSKTLRFKLSDVLAGTTSSLASQIFEPAEGIKEMLKYVNLNVLNSGQDVTISTDDTLEMERPIGDEGILKFTVEGNLLTPDVSGIDDTITLQYFANVK